MPSSRFAHAGGWSLLLLLLALATMFVSGHDRGFFYQPGEHNAVTANHLAVAANLSPEHGFLGFYRQHLSRDGETSSYEVYNRFPLGGHLLIKAALLPFPDDLSAQIRAARTLMLALLAAAAVTAFLALRRLTSSSSVALTATLLSFASFHPLFYGDMVATEGSIDLFAVLLTFHGMVVFAQEGRFRQLLAKTCGALLVGWHVYGLLPPFIVFGLAGEWRRGGGSGRSRAARLARSRHLALGVVALTFGLSVLAFNFAREYAALNSGEGRETALTDLPSFRSMTYRLGQDRRFNESHAEALAWRPFLESLFRRAGQASVPYCLSRENLWADAWAAWGLIAFVACAAGLTAVRHRVLLATLATFGFCWGLLVRHTVVFHGHEGLFLVGLPLVCFTLVMAPVRRLSERLADGCAVAAAAVFVLSSQQMHRPDSGGEASDGREIVADYDAIRTIAGEGLSVLVRVGGGYALGSHYFLAGRILEFSGRNRHRTDFLLTRERMPDALGLLTPDNRQMFLHNRAAHDLRYVVLGDPVLEGGRDWKVHRVGNRLIYTTGEACSAREGFKDEPRFFLEFLAVGEDAGSGEQRKFRFQRRSFDVAGRCIVDVVLPAPDVARIRTGQFVREGWELWSEERTLLPADGLRTPPRRGVARPDLPADTR